MRYILRLKLFFYGLAVALPLLAGLGYALGQSWGLLGVYQSGFTAAHWQKALEDWVWLESLGYSLGIAVVSLFLVLITSLGISQCLRTSLRLKFWLPLMYLPLTVPALVAAFFTFQILSGSGWVSRIAFSWAWIASAQEFPELVQDPYAIGIILSHSMLAIPFFSLLFYNLQQSENLDELEQMAASLGASPQQSLWRVRLPLLWRGAYPVILMYLIFMMGSYEIPLLLGRQSPRMISILILEKLEGFDLQERPMAYVYALLYAGFVMLLLALLLFQKGTYETNY